MASLRLNWRYLAFEVHPDQLGPAILGAKAMNFIGLNLTVPHKILAVGMVDVLDASAKNWGTVNTIRFEGQSPTQEWRGLHEFQDAPREIRSCGFNTDADAIVKSLNEDLGIVLRGARVLLLGAGGAGRTAALRLASEGVTELYLVNRTRSKSEAILDEIKTRNAQLKAVADYPASPVDLVLNATSLGMQPNDPLPYDDTRFILSKARAVYDMVYRPAETRLLSAAKAAGCRTANGLGMLLFQGAKALEIWTGSPAPLEIMRKALTKNVYG